MNEQDLKECIAEVKNSDIPNPSKKKIMKIPPVPSLFL